MTVPYLHKRQITWGDTDAAAIAYTVRFFDFAMDAIEGWFRDVCLSDWFSLNMDQQTGTPFVNINMDIVAPLTPRHCLSIYVYVEKLGGASLTFRLIGKRDDGVTSFKANFTCCFVDNQIMVSKQIPSEIRKKIEDYMSAGGQFSPDMH